MPRQFPYLVGDFAQFLAAGLWPRSIEWPAGIPRSFHSNLLAHIVHRITGGRAVGSAPP